MTFALRSLTVLATCAALAAATLPAAAQTDFLKAAAAEPGARVTTSGLVIRMVKEGQGAQPSATDTVKVHYRGTFTDGREFDSSYQRGEPASFALSGVIKCWTEGVQLIRVGGTARLTCPAGLAYGERGSQGGKIAPHTVLRFDVELLAINP